MAPNTRRRSAPGHKKLPYLHIFGPPLLMVRLVATHAPPPGPLGARCARSRRTSTPPRAPCRSEGGCHIWSGPASESPFSLRAPEAPGGVGAADGPKAGRVPAVRLCLSTGPERRARLSECCARAPPPAPTEGGVAPGTGGVPAACPDWECRVVCENAFVGWPSGALTHTRTRASLAGHHHVPPLLWRADQEQAHVDDRHHDILTNQPVVPADHHGSRSRSRSRSGCHDRAWRDIPAGRHGQNRRRRPHRCCQVWQEG